ncbi:sequence-specific DNA binding transcription factor [Abeliophyllum distichum]|uniref:Sequence-specific DNA binding transcription factor n=1 Tax=Abeliophyllum distichum TaxID=126358 RepID=A0ABD1Q828_9LAMI
MEEQSGSRRTRSQAAPDWTEQESVILINEINAVESEWGGTLPSFQKWQQIVENCNALEVNRNLNQCKRQWDALLNEYKRVKNEGDGGGGANVSFDIEVFRAIDRCVKAKGKKSDSHVTVAETDAVAEVQSVMDTDPDSDPEAQGPPSKFFLEMGSKKQGQRMKRQKRKIQRLNPWGYVTSGKIMLDESSRNEKMNTSANEESNVGMKEETLTKILRENAVHINAILEGNLADDVDYRLADLKNADAVQIDFARRQGDKLIDHFGKISETLNLLCDLVRQ